MPDRYGDEPDPVVDLDSRRHSREAAAAVERARQRRARLAETRAVHAPLTRDQAHSARAHRNAAAAQAETRRNTLRIANCALCDEQGYRGATICDHIDHRPAYRRGMDLVREVLTKGDTK